MSKIVCVMFNGERIDFNDQQHPALKSSRASPRRTGMSEKAFESQYLDLMNTRGFVESRSTANRWLRSIFPEPKVNHKKLHGFCEFLSSKLNICLGRESYRRRVCLVFWLEEHLQAISELLSQNHIEVICESSRCIVPVPHIDNHVIGGPVLISEQAEVFDPSIFGSFEDQTESQYAQNASADDYQMFEDDDIFICV